MGDYRRLIAGLSLLATTACAAKPPAGPQPGPASREQPRFEPRIGLGSPPTILWQSRGSARANARHHEPLYVVDGVQVEEAPLHLEQEDITSIRILQGDEAVAAYGSRGAHGVIVITTSRGDGK